MDKTNFDNEINNLIPNLPNVKQAFTDLGAFLDSFDIAPEGFSAVELAKRFGDIGEDITTLDTKVDTVAGDVKADINGVITDINTFIINPLISPNNKIDVTIDPISIGGFPTGVSLTKTHVVCCDVVTGVSLSTTSKNFNVPQPPVIQLSDIFSNTLGITPIATIP